MRTCFYLIALGCEQAIKVNILIGEARVSNTLHQVYIKNVRVGIKICPVLTCLTTTLTGTTGSTLGLSSTMAETAKSIINLYGT
jgi:hypothetical protein